MAETYRDNKGYLRYEDSDKLIHRYIAYKFIYLPNKWNYPLPFSKYQVHHENRNKLNNNAYNLQIVTEREHAIIHGKSYESKFISILKKISRWLFEPPIK